MSLVETTRRNREGEGRSARSWIKHSFVAKVAGSYVAAYRVSHPDDRVLLIDGNAGDGKGVPKEPDLFDGTRYSRPTPQLIVDLAQDVGNADVVLCEMDQHKRKQLWHLFPHTKVVASHAAILEQLRTDHRYALWISDPCGPKGHGVNEMRTLNQRVLCDFIIVFNEGSLNRINGTGKLNDGSVAARANATSRERYGHLIDPHWWLTHLDKRYLAQSRLIPASPGFHYRVWAISNYLTDATRREPFIEVISKR